MVNLTATALPIKWPTTENGLYGVDALSPSDAWAVGNGNDGYPAVAHWDGATWSWNSTGYVPFGPSQAYPWLRGVCAVEPANVWAVGHLSRHFGPGSLILHFDSFNAFGKPIFKQVESPWVSDIFDVLFAVDGTAPDDVWAVGVYYGADEPRQAHAIRFDGASWRVERVPAGPDTQFNAVHMVGRQQLWAVGQVIDEAGAHNALTWFYDGAGWQNHPNPLSRHHEHKTHAELYGVGGSAPDDVWAVGNIGRQILHFDGARWAAVNVDGEWEGWLYAVTAASAADAWAVGVEWISSFERIPLLLHWDGRAWTRVPAPTVMIPGTSRRFPHHDVRSAVTIGDQLIAAGCYSQSGGTVGDPFSITTS